MSAWDWPSACSSQPTPSPASPAPTTPLAVPAAAAAGVPLYFGTELFIPIGDALHAKGVGIGSIVALVIAGAGANIPEFALLTKIARGRVVAAFFAYVFVVATVAGLLTDLIL